MARIVICGGPGTGKTTLADSYDCKVIHTDSFIELGWSGASSHVARLMVDTAGPWVVEGVAAIRALRKALAEQQKPCDKVIWLSKVHRRQGKGQRTMTTGCETVLREIKPLFGERGIAFEEVE